MFFGLPMVFLTLSVHGKRSTSPPERRAYENKEAVAATGKKKREELGTMTEENYQKLQNIGFEFEWQNLRYSFDQRTDHLAEELLMALSCSHLRQPCFPTLRPFSCIVHFQSDSQKKLH